MRLERLGHIEKCPCTQPSADNLSADRQALDCLTARQGNGRMPRDVEELGQSQHDVANGLLWFPPIRTVSAPRLGAGTGRVGKRRPSQSSSARSTSTCKDVATAQGPDVVLAEDVASHLEAQAHVRRVVVRTAARASWHDRRLLRTARCARRLRDIVGMRNVGIAKLDAGLLSRVHASRTMTPPRHRAGS